MAQCRPSSSLRPQRYHGVDSRGHFRVASTFGSAAWDTRNAAVADLNGDGLPDIVVANRSDHATQYVCLNQGKGRFSATCDAVANYSSTTITPVDVNHDGRIDLVVPHRDGGQSYVYLNGGNASFSPARRVPFGPSNGTVRMTLAGDFDGDGLVDLVLIDDQHKKVEICYGSTGGGFAPAALLDPGEAPYALAVADLDGDGQLDIAVARSGAPNMVYFGGTERR